MYWYAVDVKIVLDAKKSMRPIIDDVKRLAGEIASGMEAIGKPVGILRVSVIAFRDFGIDGHDAFIDSGFFTLPYDEDEFKEFVSSIAVFGGGDQPKNSLEALAYALQGDWSGEGKLQRHVTILLTDAPPHPYGTVTGPGIPCGLPETLDEALEIWRGNRQEGPLSQRGKRLYLVIPSGNKDFSSWEDEEFVAVMPIDEVLGSPKAATEFIVSTVVHAC